MSIILKVQVRRTKYDNSLQMFSRNEEFSRHSFTCFSFAEGHNECDDSYRLNCCLPVTKAEAEPFIVKVQAYYDSIPDEKVTLQLVKRL